MLGQQHAEHHQLEEQSVAMLLLAPVPADVNTNQSCKAEAYQDRRSILS